MKKQKICIIGGSLTGLVTAISLSELNCEIDIIMEKPNKSLKSNRTIAVSDDNLELIKKLKISKNIKSQLWPCSIMKLYSGKENKKFSKIFELNNENKKKKIFHILESSKVIKLMLNKIYKNNLINIKYNKKISKIYESGSSRILKINNTNNQYNLVIVCTGGSSPLVQNIFKNKFLISAYNEISITTILSHNPIKNNTARQIFFDKEILALLPVSKTKTSIVWTVKRDLYKKNDALIKSKIKNYCKDYYKKIKFIKKIEIKPLNFILSKEYYKGRILLFGDALHTVHPFVGQGFNMTLRDLYQLKKILNNKINLGLDIGDLNILSEFSKIAKSKNFMYSIGINLLKKTFSMENKFSKQAREKIIKKLDKNALAKNIFYNVADKGIAI